MLITGGSEGADQVSLASMASVPSRAFSRIRRGHRRSVRPASRKAKPDAPHVGNDDAQNRDSRLLARCRPQPRQRSLLVGPGRAGYSRRHLRPRSRPVLGSRSRRVAVVRRGFAPIPTILATSSACCFGRGPQVQSEAGFRCMTERPHFRGDLLSIEQLSADLCDESFRLAGYAVDGEAEAPRSRRPTRGPASKATARACGLALDEPKRPLRPKAPGCSRKGRPEGVVVLLGSW